MHLTEPARWLPGPLRRLAPARAAALVQFVQFALVGSAGLAVDIVTVYGLRGVAGLYWAGLAGFAVAVNVNFMLNRTWTFRSQRRLSLGRQWRRFLVANTGGFVVNRGVYAVLIWSLPFVRVHPVVAIVCGVVAAMFLNFQLTRSIVFH